MIPDLSPFPSLKTLSHAVRRARGRLRKIGQATGLVVFDVLRGDYRVESPTLEWAPIAWPYLVGVPRSPAFCGPVVCIDHDVRFSRRMPRADALDNGEHRRAAFHAIRESHLPGYPTTSILHLVALRGALRRGSLLIHFPRPDEVLEEGRCLPPTVCEALMRAFGMAHTHLH